MEMPKAFLSERQYLHRLFLYLTAVPIETMLLGDPIFSLT
jgi:hypothetical protein